MKTALRCCHVIGGNGLPVFGGTVVDDHLGTIAAGVLLFDPWRVGRHDDQGRKADNTRRRGNALRMVAGGIGHDSPGVRAGSSCEMAVPGAAELEGAGALQALGFQQHPPADDGIEDRRFEQRRP